MINFLSRNETKALIAELTLKSIEANLIEGSSARSLAPEERDESERDSKERWERVVRDTLAQGKVGNLNVDPEFLVFEPQSREYFEFEAK